MSTAAKERAKGLREAADLLDKIGDMEIWSNTTINILCEKAEIAKVARQLVPFEKKIDETYYNVIHQCSGGVAVCAYVNRKEICELRKVVKEVEEFVCPDSILEPEALVDKEAKP